MIDLAITVAMGLLTVAVGYLGIRLTLHPLPQDPQQLEASQKRYKLAFILLSLAGLGLVIFQGIRNQRAQTEASAEQQNALKRVEQAENETRKVRKELGDTKTELTTLITGSETKISSQITSATKPPLPSVWHRPLTQTETARAMSILTAEHQRPHLRIGCAASSEEACALASQLIVLFQSAGWVVEKVPAERLQLPKALLGVAFFSHGEGTADPSNSLQGLWVKQTRTLRTLASAFAVFGVNVQSAADATMPEGTMGIYFGPDPGLGTPYYLNSR